MKSVSHIFGGEAKVKIMRLFVFNPNQVFPSSTVAERTKEKPSKVRRELANLVKAGLIKKRSKGYILDTTYVYLPAIENFLIDATPLSEREIINKVVRAGQIKLVLISGIFMHDRDSRVDILIVGDNMKNAKLLSVISSIEAELGKEIRYAAFDTADFRYRLGIYDKLIRDILDYKHKKILNRLGI